MKLSHGTLHKVGLITYVHILGGRTSKILQGQKVENSSRFRTTFDFDCEYLRNQWRCRK